MVWDAILLRLRLTAANEFQAQFVAGVEREFLRLQSEFPIKANFYQRARGRISPGDPVNCDCLRGSACGGWRHLQDVSAEAEEVRYEVRELIEVEHAVVLREDVGDLTLSVTVFAARHLRIEQLPCLSLSYGALGVNS